MEGGGGGGRLNRKEVYNPLLYLLFAFLFSFPPETPYSQAGYILSSS